MRMPLTHPDSRRALRSIVQALVALAVVILVAIIIDHLQGQPRELYGLGMGCLVIIGIGTLLYGAENVTRAVKFKGPLGIEGGIGEEQAIPVQVVNPPADPVPTLPQDPEPR